MDEFVKEKSREIKIALNKQETWIGADSNRWVLL